MVKWLFDVVLVCVVVRNVVGVVWVSEYSVVCVCWKVVCLSVVLVGLMRFVVIIVWVSIWLLIMLSGECMLVRMWFLLSLSLWLIIFWKCLGIMYVIVSVLCMFFVECLFGKLLFVVGVVFFVGMSVGVMMMFVFY